MKHLSIFFAVLIATFVVTSERLGAEQARVVTEEETNSILKLCAVGRVRGIDSSISADIARTLRRFEVDIEAFYSDVGGILERIQSTDVGTEYYDRYLACVTQQTEVLRSGGELDYRLLLEEALQRIEELETSSSSLDLDLGAVGMAELRIFLTRGMKTTVRVNSNCSLYAWIAGVHYDGSPFTLALAIPELSIFLERFPQTIELTRTHQLVSQGYRLSPTFSEDDQNKIARHYEASHDEIRVSFVLRTLENRDDCQGTYAVRQVTL